MPVSVIISPLQDAGGKVVAAITITRDITERRTLRRPCAKDKLLRLVMDVMPAGVFITDPEGRIKSANQAAHKYGQRQVVGISQYGEYKCWWPETASVSSLKTGPPPGRSGWDCRSTTKNSRSRP